MDDQNLNQYQSLANRTSGAGGDGKLRIIIAALGLAGEAGEFANMVKKLTAHGHDIPLEDLAEELGDVLWYVAEAASACGIDLGSIGYKNIEKLRNRYPKGFVRNGVSTGKDDLTPSRISFLLVVEPIEIKEKFMSQDLEIRLFLEKHIQAIMDNDIKTYHVTTSEGLTLYEWFVTPHRIDGIPFHDFMMESNSDQGTVFGADVDTGDEGDKPETRFDLANLKIQRFGETAIASYTLLLSTKFSSGVQVIAHNESRVIVNVDGEWKVVHVHKSPAWNAPHVQP